MHETRFTRFVVAAILAGACGEAPSGSGFDGTVRDSVGIRIVENSRDGFGENSGRWTVEEIATIGEAAGDPDYQFGHVAALDVFPDGRIAVLDQQAQRIQIYDPDGTYLRSVGGPGSGPGEFSTQALALFVGRGDTIVVPDVGNQRITLVPPNGEPTSFPLRMEEGVPMGFDMTLDGRLVSQRRAPNASDPRLRGAAEDLVLAQAYDGTIIDTLLTPKRPDSFELGESGPRFRLLAAEPQWTILADGHLAYGTNDAYRIRIYGHEGELEQIVTLPHEVRAVSSTDREVSLDLLRASMRNRGAQPEDIERMLGAVTFADSLPVFNRLVGGPRGTLWVQRQRDLTDVSRDEIEDWTFQGDLGASQWDVFEADGRYGGVAAFPPRFTPLAFVEDRIYGTYRDEFDVQYVRIYRLQRRS